MRLKIIGLVVTALVLAVAFVAPAGAQTADFTATLSSTQQLSNQLDTALAQPTDATMQAAVTQALTMAQALSKSLKAIETSATDDPTRSRASGLRAHIDAAIGSLTSAQTAKGDALRSQINAAKAEVRETLAEFPGGGGGVPITGGPGLLTSTFSVLALVGLSMLLVGLAMRRLEPARR
ncbi:MAG: hypothetical protein M1358_20430 [Chloroflexi bacterium]|nr:hypothetical protein [Chloroflexota bacterium]